MTIVRLGADVVSSSPAARQFFFIYIYSTARQRNIDSLKTKTKTHQRFVQKLFAPFSSMNYMGKNKTLQKRHGIFIHKQNQTNPLAHVNITPTPEVFTCKTRQGDASSITSSNKDNMLSQL